MSRDDDSAAPCAGCCQLHRDRVVVHPQRERHRRAGRGEDAGHRLVRGVRLGPSILAPYRSSREARSIRAACLALGSSPAPTESCFAALKQPASARPVGTGLLCIAIGLYLLAGAARAFTDTWPFFLPPQLDGTAVLL